MLYVGMFQINWIHHLACPGFGSGCESVAVASYSFPLGLADGLLLAALGGLIAAAAQIAGKEAAVILVVLAFVDLLACLVGALEMIKMGAWSLWWLLATLLAVAMAALAPVCARASERGSGDAPAPPDDHAQQAQ